MNWPGLWWSILPVPCKGFRNVLVEKEKFNSTGRVLHYGTRGECFEKLKLYEDELLRKSLYSCTQNEINGYQFTECQSNCKDFGKTRVDFLDMDKNIQLNDIAYRIREHNVILLVIVVKKFVNFVNFFIF